MAITEYVELDRADGETVTALICPMQQQHLVDFDSIWKPMLEALDGEDAFWDWARKKRLALTDDRYEGVGSALLSFARQRSLDLGYGGRLGLHALPGTESFYESRNMLNLGYDPDQEMIYFEYGVLNRLPREESDA